MFISDAHTHAHIWDVDLADIQLISNFDKDICFLLCVIDIFSNYAWVFTLKKSITVNNAFQNILDESNLKPKKILGDKSSKYYKRSIKSWLQDNNIEMYSRHNEGKSVVTERFIRTLNKKNHKYMTSISKNVYINKLDNIVNKYNNTYHRTIKMKPVDLKSSIYIDFNKESNK